LDTESKLPTHKDRIDDKTKMKNQVKCEGAAGCRSEQAAAAPVEISKRAFFRGKKEHFGYNWNVCYVG